MSATLNFRTNLRTAIDVRGISQSAISEATGMSKPYISRVLTGKVESPSMENCERLANAVGYPLTALLVSPEDFSESVLTLR